MNSPSNDVESPIPLDKAKFNERIEIILNELLAHIQSLEGQANELEMQFECEHDLQYNESDHDHDWIVCPKCKFTCYAYNMK